MNYLYYVCSGSMEVLKQEQVVAILGTVKLLSLCCSYKTFFSFQKRIQFFYLCEYIITISNEVSRFLYYFSLYNLDLLITSTPGKGDIFGTDLDYDDPVSVSGCDVRSLAYCELLCIQVKFFFRR